MSELLSKYKRTVSKLFQIISKLADRCQKPFEIEWIEHEDGRGIQYLLVQYLCFGQCLDDYHQAIEGLGLTKAVLQ